MTKQETGDFLLFNKFQVKCLLRVTCHMIPGMEGEGCCGLHEKDTKCNSFSAGNMLYYKGV